MCFLKGEKNILGTELVNCSSLPLTGFYRDGIQSRWLDGVERSAYGRRVKVTRANNGCRNREPGGVHGRHLGGYQSKARPDLWVRRLRVE